MKRSKFNRGKRSFGKRGKTRTTKIRMARGGYRM